MMKASMAAMAALAIGLLPSAVSADEAPALDGSGWINATDLSLARLRGKVVVLYFFEES